MSVVTSIRIRSSEDIEVAILNSEQPRDAGVPVAYLSEEIARRILDEVSVTTDDLAAAGISAASVRHEFQTSRLDCNERGMLNLHLFLGIQLLSPLSSISSSAILSFLSKRNKEIDPDQVMPRIGGGTTVTPKPGTAVGSIVVVESSYEFNLRAIRYVPPDKKPSQRVRTSSTAIKSWVNIRSKQTIFQIPSGILEWGHIYGGGIAQGGCLLTASQIQDFADRHLPTIGEPFRKDSGPYIQAIGMPNAEGFESLSEIDSLVKGGSAVYHFYLRGGGQVWTFMSRYEKKIIKLRNAILKNYLDKP